MMSVADLIELLEQVPEEERGNTSVFISVEDYATGGKTLEDMAVQIDTDHHVVVCEPA